MIQNQTYKEVTLRNCRNKLKRKYQLAFEVNMELLFLLEKYGKLNIIDFSQFNSTANDLFSIKGEKYEISGSLDEDIIYIVCFKKEDFDNADILEDISDFYTFQYS